MSRAQFEIAFEGEPFEAGEIDVRDLAPALLAFGNLVQASNKALNGDRADARLRVAATADGSFKAALSVEVSWVVDMLDAVARNPDRVVAADQLLDLLIKGGTVAGGAAATGYGLIKAVQFLKGRRPDRLHPTDEGKTEITVNHTTIVVDDRTVDLLQDVPTREALEEFAKKTEAVSGLETLRIGAEGSESEPIRLKRADLPSFRVPEETEDEREHSVSHHEAWLRIVSSHFRDGYKWRFTDGGERPFTATIEDQDFLKKVQDGAIALNAHDAMRCRLREEQTVTRGGLTKEIFVEQVLDYRPGARQLKLI